MTLQWYFMGRRAHELREIARRDVVLFLCVKSPPWGKEQEEDEEGTCTNF